MNSRQGLENGHRSLDRLTDIAVSERTTRSDRLDYIADMVQALRAMSACADCPILTNFLDLAYHEAVRCRRAGKAR